MGRERLLFRLLFLFLLQKIVLSAAIFSTNPALTLSPISSLSPQQQWERVGNPSSSLSTFQRVTSGGIEEVMESKPYGLEVGDGREELVFLLT